MIKHFSLQLGASSYLTSSTEFAFSWAIFTNLNSLTLTFDLTLFTDHDALPLSGRKVGIGGVCVRGESGRYVSIGGNV